MNLKEVFDSAREKCANCKVCPECNGLACKGQIPGMGGKDSGSSFIRNVEALKKVKLNMDVSSDNGPIDTSCTVLGYDMPLPVFVAPLAGIKGNYGADMSEYDYNLQVIEGCNEIGILPFCGDGIDAEVLFKKPAEAISNAGGRGIVTMKPWVKEGIDERLEILKDINYAMLAMDIDAAGLPLLRAGKTPVQNKNVSSLKYVKDGCGKPFIVKGVMTKHAAQVAVDAGADAIIVSNHGGRVCDDTLGTVEVLEDIVKEFKGKITILIDGGIRTGNDIFKCLALGADGVLIGRPFGLSVIGGGKEGLKLYYNKLQFEFSQAMLMTGCHSVKEITRDKVEVVK